MSMIPFGNETVTLVQRTESVSAETGKTQVSYAAVTLTNCSWRRVRRVQREGEMLVPYEGITCRVPAGQTRPRTGDLLILGDVTVTVTGGADYRRLIEQYSGSDGAFVAASVADCARPGMPLPHWAARSGGV